MGYLIMTKRDEVLRKIILDTPQEGVEGEFFCSDDYKNEKYEESHKEIISYNGEFSLINLGPIKIKQLKEKNDPNIDKKALEIALNFWDMRSCPHEAGEPYRGTDVESINVSSLKECIGKERVDFIVSNGLVSDKGCSELSDEIIDYDFLLSDES